MSDNLELNELLIQNVSKCPLIHTKKSKSFKNNNRKRKAWEDIRQSIYAKLGINMTVTEVKNTWKKLRDQYQAERAKKNLYIASGSGAPEEDFEFPYFKTMNFLEDTPRHSKNVYSPSKF
ncbi:uncharacterized protein LOC122500412 [Leptopilina heterotoma]|uniref:uncharacterized protein LOC122500412 n=1 Tax=Leptopilina heterotoma TaxID=63436 RepID=UPI001CA8B24E|nr:uncharacterized protein LOC122500412 [Leptopilina heterotoma]